MLFRIYCEKFKCEYNEQVVEYLLKTHYIPKKRRLRRCHPRDLLSQIRNFCVYNDIPVELRPEFFDRVAKSYFTDVLEGAPRTLAKGIS